MPSQRLRRIATPACTTCSPTCPPNKFFGMRDKFFGRRERFGEGRDYGVQARTFQVLAMTDW
jgi:hypothetical protein